MRVLHLLRKCDPAEWGGTETAVQRLLDGLRGHEVDSVVYCPRLNNRHLNDPLVEAGWPVRRYNARVPVWGISARQKRQLIAVGGNLVSFDLLPLMWSERPVDVIHTHTLGRLGASALYVAKRRGVPFVITIHGGVADLPAAVKTDLDHASAGGLEWGKLAGLLLRTSRFLLDADAIITCNEREACSLRAHLPTKRILVQPHGVSVSQFSTDRRDQARVAFPQIRQRQVLLSVGRIDPVKNQRWLVEEMPSILQRHRKALMVFAGSCTNETYGQLLNERICQLGLEDHVLLTGGMVPGDSRLIGLLQEASAVLLPSVSETFGLTLLEAWAAGTPVIASRTSGATALIKHLHNGWLFDLSCAATYHDAVDSALLKPELAKGLAAEGHRLVSAQFDNTTLAGPMRTLYEQLIEEKNALHNHSR